MSKAAKTVNQGGLLINTLKGNDMTIKDSIGAERLRELLSYDPETGVFKHKRQGLKISIGDVAGNSSHLKGYVQIRADYKRYYAHRLAWVFVHGDWPVGVIDHINGITSDNRIANLRDVSQSVNRQNQKVSNSAMGMLGVCLNKKTGRYVAQIGIKGKQKGLGYFDTPEDAKSAYLAAKRLHHPQVMD